MAVASGLSLGTAFGTTLVLVILPFLYAMSVFGVEFTIHSMKQPQVTEFSTEGIRFFGPNLIPRTFAWKDLTSVRVRSVGPRRAPAALVFVFRRRFLIRLVHVDLPENTAVAARITAFVARYAPKAPRVGKTGTLSWDPSLALGGDAAVVARRFQPGYYAGMAVFGPFMNLYFTSIALAVGFVQDKEFAWAMVGAYVVIGILIIMYCWETISSQSPGSKPSSQRQSTVKVLFLAGIFLVLLQPVVAVLLLT